MSTSASPNHVCYVHCNFCNTILVVCVPGTNWCSIMTVRCGHCSNLLSVNMGGHLHSLPGLQDLQKLQGHNNRSEGLRLDSESSSRCNRIPLFNAMGSNQQDITPTHTSEKRQRAPSAYNRFIKEEIRRLKTTNPDISHREAFSAAAKNKSVMFEMIANNHHFIFGINENYVSSQWAHFPYIQFGLNHNANKQVKIDDPITTQGGQESQSYY